MPLIALPEPSDWTLGTGLEVIGGMGIGLSYDLNVYDDFNLNTNPPDAAKWTVRGNTVGQNQQVEMDGTNTWTITGLISKIAKTIRRLWGVQGTLSLPSLGDQTFGFTSNNFTLFDPGSAYAGILVNFNGAGDLNIFWGKGVVAASSDLGVGSGYNAGDDYTFRIVYDHPGFRVYVQSLSDANYLNETLLSTNTDLVLSGSQYMQLSCFTNYAGTVATFDDAKFTSYSDLSPIAEAPWIAIDQETLDAVAPFLILENAIGTLQGISTLGNIRYQYAINGGPFNGVWLTLAQIIAALSGLTITNHINSLKLRDQHNSDGIQAADISGFGAFSQASGIPSTFSASYELPQEIILEDEEFVIFEGCD